MQAWHKGKCMTQLTQRTTWRALEAHAESIDSLSFDDLERLTPDRKIDFKHTACGIELDFSKQRITKQTLELLFRLAEESQVKEKIDALIRGDRVNYSENRPALHTALRLPEGASLWVEGHDVMTDIFSTRERMKIISERIRCGMWHGYSNKPVTDIVNIGMGGSDLGAKLCVTALGEYVSEALNFHFISDADPDSFQHTVAALNPETTLFIVASKSFTTQETLYNARKAMKWIGHSSYFKHHFIAVTASIEKAYTFGIQEVLPIWDWVGGRYSSCSAMNLATVIAVGFKRFNEFLAGAHAMDVHFKNAPLDRNLPMLAALLGIWNNNFLNIHTVLMLIYSNRLEQLVQYVQQLDMESNGKSIDRENKIIDYATGPIIWGGLGNRAQHSYYQLLSQGTHQVAVEFIRVKALDGHLVNVFCEVKQHVLTKGVGRKEELRDYIPGNTSVMQIQVEQNSPYTLGALISFHEHKAYTQSVVWNTNSFDQPGVESAKESEKNNAQIVA